MLIQEHIILSSFISKVDYTAKYVCHFAVDMYHSLKTFGIVNWVIVLNHTVLNLRRYNKIIWYFGVVKRLVAQLAPSHVFKGDT